MKRLTLHSTPARLLCVSWLAVALAGACTEPTSETDAGDTTAHETAEDTAGDGGSTGDATDTDASGTADTTDPSDTGPPEADEQLIHQFDPYTLEPGEEAVPCVQWTLNNEKPLYVNAVTLANQGGFHHSNWFVTPEDYAAGEDGYFDCEERGFREVQAALQGTVLFAQSTQARSETQQFPEGVVIKIPPNHKIVADVHFLNIATRQLETSARMTLGLTHPKNVDTVVAPFRLSYYDLEIPPDTQSRFTGGCEMAEPYRNKAGHPFDMKIYYVLPHYHGLGNYFGLEILGGPRDGAQLFELTGFNAEANGQMFDPPIDLGDAEGLRFTCGYDNPRDETVGWGIGDQEMCVMLGFADSDAVIDAAVNDGNRVVDERDGVVYNEGPCSVLSFQKNDNQDMPSEQEKQGEMYLPEGDSEDELAPIPECEEYDGTADPLRSPTLTNLQRDVFSVGCAYSACHSGESAAAGLDLTADDLHTELLNHEVATPTDHPLVEPGDPEGSWLYRVTSKCEPMAKNGPVAHMPRNSPTLLEPRVLAMIREWIARGAQDD